MIDNNSILNANTLVDSPIEELLNGEEKYGFLDSAEDINLPIFLNSTSFLTTITLPDFPDFPTVPDSTDEPSEREIDNPQPISSLISGFSTEESVSAISDRFDSYEFSLTQSGIFEVELSDLNADADVRLIHDLNGNGAVDTGEVIAWQWERGNNSESIYAFLEPGNYFLEVEAISSYDINDQGSIATGLASGAIGATSATDILQETVDYTLETEFTPTTNDPYEFDIQLGASDVWEDAISHSSFDGDHQLDIEITIGDRGEGVLASANYLTLEEDSNGLLMPTSGFVIINSDPEMFAALESDIDRFTDVLIHEFAHVLGFGGLWQPRDLIDEDSAEYNADTYAGTVFGELLGTDRSTPIPLTTGVGEGSDLAHWDEATFQSELMTHASEIGVSAPLSELTIAALRDLGWNVNYGAAEPFELPEPSDIA